MATVPYHSVVAQKKPQVLLQPVWKKAKIW